MVRVVTYQGQKAVAGLRWGSRANRPFWRAAPIAAHWSTRTAFLQDGENLIGTNSLLSLLAGSLPDKASRGTIFFAFEDVSQDLFFAAVTVTGKPRLAEETVFEDRKTFLAYVNRECGSGGIDGIATTAELAKLINTDVKIALIGDLAQAHIPVRVEGAARKQHTHRMLVGSIAAIGVAGCAVFAGFLWAKQPEPEPEVIPKVAVIIDRAVFEQSCLEAFREGWPRAPGWEITGEGCATPDMRDPALNGTPRTEALAYREYRLNKSYNGEIARRAAEAVHEGTKVTLHVEEQRLFATKVIHAPLIEMGQGEGVLPTKPSLADLRDEASAIFLGSLSLKISLPSGAEPRVRIELEGSFEEVLATARRMPVTAISRLSRKGETVTLDLTPEKPRFVPVSSIEKGL